MGTRHAMTRNQHWTEAQRLLIELQRADLFREERMVVLMEAQVHATLASAPREVVGE